MMVKLVIATALFLVAPCTMAKEACCGIDSTVDRDFTEQLVSRVGSFLYEGSEYGGDYLRSDNNVTVCNLPEGRSQQKSFAVRVYNDYRDEYLRIDVYSTKAWSIRDIDSTEYRRDTCTHLCALCAH